MIFNFTLGTDSSFIYNQTHFVFQSSIGASVMFRSATNQLQFFQQSVKAMNSKQPVIQHQQAQQSQQPVSETAADATSQNFLNAQHSFVR